LTLEEDFAGASIICSPPQSMRQQNIKDDLGSLNSLDYANDHAMVHEFDFCACSG